MCDYDTGKGLTLDLQLHNLFVSCRQLFLEQCSHSLTCPGEEVLKLQRQNDSGRKLGKQKDEISVIPPTFGGSNPPYLIWRIDMWNTKAVRS